MKVGINSFFLALGVIFSLYSFNNIASAETIATLRQNTVINIESSEPALLQNPTNTITKQVRSYPMQPPLIPHATDNYQIDLHVNKCLSCHARKRVSESLAPMVSVTHFMDRDGNFLADVSPRRFFCLQCHVTQVDRPVILENTFKDIDALMARQKKSR